MKEFTLETEIWLRAPREQVFRFFADAANLQALTPDWLDFEILTPQPIDLRPGALIDYRIRVHRIPIRWRTEIVTWEPPVRFVDIQLKGPYRLWHHTHEFHEHNGGTLCRDLVRYSPIGGTLANRLFVRRDVERIFQFRQAQLRKRFG
ncbi:MAG: SRPBCC family protein [Verrucomicrobiota bacterium]